MLRPSIDALTLPRRGPGTRATPAPSPSPLHCLVFFTSHLTFSSCRLAIIQMLMKRVNPSTGAFEHKPGELKAIYMAPLKALVQEKKAWARLYLSPLPHHSRGFVHSCGTCCP